MRDNPDLDAAFGETSLNGSTALPKPRRRRKASADRDVTRRTAFRVLSLLAGLDAPGRERVLKAALRLNRA